MISHDALIAAKIALLETVMKDMMVERFSSMTDPVMQLKSYAAQRIRPAKNPEPAEEELQLIVATVWSQFFDDLERRLIDRLGNSDPKR